MAELSRHEHDALGGGFNPAPYFGGLITELGGIYVPPELDHDDDAQTYFRSIVDLLHSLNTRLANVMQGYVFKDEGDSALEFSVSAFTINAMGQLCTYAGETHLGPLTRSTANYIYADLRSPPNVTIVVASAWPSISLPHYRLSIITPQASGHWLETDHSRVGSMQTPIIGGRVSTILIPFAFDAATIPVPLITLPAGVRVKRVTVRVDTAFNVGSPTCSVGYSGAAEALLPVAAGVDLKTIGTYTSDELLVKFSSDKNLELALSNASSTAGDGVVCLEIIA